MLFKRKQIEAAEPEPQDWWKDPRLDDEGTYDYLAEPLPQDHCEWSFKYSYRCDSCGKEHRINFNSTSYFYCWDGWDSMSHTECWVCMLGNQIYHYKRIAKNAILNIVDALRESYYLCNNAHVLKKFPKVFVTYYKIAKQYRK